MLVFPEKFLWGISSSAHQFEGHNVHNQWHEWEQRGRIRSGDSCGRACDWWTNAERDLDLCAELGLNSVRISVDWGRLEPTDGRFDSDALQRYAEILAYTRSRGMRPFVTLHHFTHPLWFEKAGAFLQRDSAERFADFCSRIVSELHPLCSDWLTFNEPNVYAVFGYIFAEFPPAVQNRVQDCATVLLNMHRAHALAYNVIHEIQPHAFVGLATNWVEFKPNSGRVDERLMAYVYDALFNRSSLELLHSGGIPFPLGAMVPNCPEIMGKIDFIGLNVYNRLHVRTPWAASARSTGGILVPGTVPQGDCGVALPYGEAYPDAIRSAVIEYSALGVPLYVTENGVPDRTDRIRPWVLVQTLRRVAELINDGYDLRGYFHWSLVDNFEWNEGWRLRFGLFEMDPETQVRLPRPSAAIYSRIIDEKKLGDELLSRFSEPPVTADAASH